MSKLSLKSRKNLKENEEKKAAHLAKIEGATGKSGLVYEFDEVACDTQLNENRYENRIGEIVVDSYLDNLSQFLVKFCEDEDNKEALLELWTSNKIRFEFNEESETYQNTKLENGDFVMYCKAANIWANVGTIGADLESKL